MNKKISPVAQLWQKELAEVGYETNINNFLEYKDAVRLRRVWKTIFKVVKLRKNASVFEFGCGGGKHLVQLAMQGYKCSGIDSSEDVLSRCKRFINSVENYSKKHIDIKLYSGDFANFKTDKKFDLVFNFGVIEHFLDSNERMLLVQKMFDICNSGGYIISVVPNGMHPFREVMKKENLGGYVIPEIDYSPELMIKEFQTAGAKRAYVLPHNLFGYLLVDNKVSGFKKIFNKGFYYFAQLVPLVSNQFTYKHAFSLICIGEK